MNKLSALLNEIHLKHLIIPVVFILFVLSAVNLEHTPAPDDDDFKVLNMLEKIKDGSKVIIVVNFGPEAKYELEEPLSAILLHFARKKVGVVFVTLVPEGIESAFMAVERVVAKIDVEKGDYLYGNSYAHIGYAAGNTLGAMMIATDVYSVRNTDTYGQSLNRLPVMNGIYKLDDFSAIIEFSSRTVDGTPGMVLISSFASNNIPKAVFCSTDMTSVYMPFYMSGSIDAFSGGYRSLTAISKKLDTDSAMGKRYMTMTFILSFILMVIIFSGIRRVAGGER